MQFFFDAGTTLHKVLDHTANGSWETWFAAGRGTADLNGDLSANDAWNAFDHGVRLTDTSAFLHPNDICVALLATLRFTHGFGACLGNHCANLIITGFSPLFGNHFANAVLTGSRTLFADHFTGGVVDLLGPLLSNHFAYLVILGFRSFFANDFTGSVFHLSGFGFWYHLPDRVIAYLFSRFRNHLANLVVANLGSAFRDTLANGVGDISCATLSSVPLAADLSCLTSGDPHLFADRFRWALDRLYSAPARFVDAFSTCLVIFPASWLPDKFPHFWAWHTDRLGLPVSASYLDGFGVVFWHKNGVVLRPNFLFANGIVYRVVDSSLSSLILGYADGVLDCALFRLINGFAHGIVDGFSVRLIDRFSNGVMKRSLLGFINRFADRIFHFLSVVLVNRFANGVIHYTFFRFVNRLHHGVFGGFCFGLVFGDHHRILDILGDSFGNKTGSLDLFVLIINLSSRAVPGFLNPVIDDLADGFHAGIGPACNWNFLRSCFLSDVRFPASIATFVAHGATISGTRVIRCESERRNC